MKKHFLTSLFLVLISTLLAQVPQKVVVEHFTNSRCGICASRNPGFFTNLMNHPDVLHLAIHPSSPYSTCIFSQHNPSENDARTNYYGVFGGTPKLVINGVPISTAQNYGAASMFTPYLGQTTALDIRVDQTKYNSDSIHARVVIQTVGNAPLLPTRLFVAVVEDTVFYNAPNGEDEHYDVFRKALTSADGVGINPGPFPGDSVEYSAGVGADPEWDFSRVYLMAILQDQGSKEVLQVGVSQVSDNIVITGVDPVIGSDFRVYPNPVQNELAVSTTDNGPFDVELFTAKGELIRSAIDIDQSWNADVSGLPPGLYLLKVSSPKGKLVRKIMKY